MAEDARDAREVRDPEPPESASEPTAAEGEVAASRGRVPPENVTQAHALAGHRTLRSLGVVGASEVRSRNLAVGFYARLRAALGGGIAVYRELLEDARARALESAVDRAERLGANAVLGLRFANADVGDGMCEVFCYGTAALVEPDAQPLGKEPTDGVDATAVLRP